MAHCSKWHDAVRNAPARESVRTAAMTQRRDVQPETLDALAADDPRAVRSRGDLRRIHRAMGTSGLLTRALRSATSPRRPLRLLELGAGDGRQMLAVAARLASAWPAVELTLLDRQPVVAASTLAAFARLGWAARPLVADVFDWVARPVSTASAESAAKASAVSGTANADVSALRISGGTGNVGAGPGTDSHWDVIVATLFLHHFTDAPLSRLLAAAAGRCDVFLACEPRRGRPALLASYCVGLLGANVVTREDALLSVRAGFRGAELSALWPGETASGWRLDERRAGPFSHRFLAVRQGLPR